MRKGILRKLSAVFIASAMVVTSVFVADVIETRAEDEEVMPVDSFCLKGKNGTVSDEWIWHSEAFELTEVDDDIWEQTFTDVPAHTDSYEILLKASSSNLFGIVDGDAAVQSGRFYDITNSGDAEYIKFDVAVKSNVTVRVDLSECNGNYSTGGKVSVIVSPVEEQVLEPGTEAPPSSNMIYTVENISYTGSAQRYYGIEYTCTLVPYDGFMLPSYIDIYLWNIEGEYPDFYENVHYTYDPATGEIWISADAPSCDIRIEATSYEYNFPEYVVSGSESLTGYDWCEELLADSSNLLERIEGDRRAHYSEVPVGIYMFKVLKFENPYESTVIGRDGTEECFIIRVEQGEYDPEGTGSFSIRFEEDEENPVLLDGDAEFLNIEELIQVAGENVTYEIESFDEDGYVIALTAASGYELGDTIEVTIGGEEYDGYAFDEATGKIVIPSEDVTGEIVITVVAEEESDEPGEEPGNQPGNEPGDESGNEPGNESGDEPGNEPGDEPGNQPGDEPGTGNGSGAGTSTGTGNGSGAGAGTSTGTGNGSGAGAGTSTGTGNGSGAGAGTSTGTGDGSGAGTSTGTGNGSGAGTNTGTGASGGSTSADSSTQTGDTVNFGLLVLTLVVAAGIVGISYKKKIMVK